MQIDKSLNLAFPVTWRDTGERYEPVLWAYHTPLGREAFETSYRLFTSVKQEIFAHGLANAADNGPVIATNALRHAAQVDAAQWGGNAPELANAVLAEIRRLTSVLVPSSTGFELTPVDYAIQRGSISAEDWSEAESGLVFFTCGYWLTTNRGRKEIAESLASLLMGSITSLAPMEFAASLPTSTTNATSEPPATSSPPS